RRCRHLPHRYAYSYASTMRGLLVVGSQHRSRTFVLHCDPLGKNCDRCRNRTCSGRICSRVPPTSQREVLRWMLCCGDRRARERAVGWAELFTRPDIARGSKCWVSRELDPTYDCHSGRARRASPGEREPESSKHGGAFIRRGRGYWVPARASPAQPGSLG